MRWNRKRSTKVYEQRKKREKKNQLSPKPYTSRYLLQTGVSECSTLTLAHAISSEIFFLVVQIGRHGNEQNERWSEVSNDNNTQQQQRNIYRSEYQRLRSKEMKEPVIFEYYLPSHSLLIPLTDFILACNHSIAFNATKANAQSRRKKTRFYFEIQSRSFFSVPLLLSIFFRSVVGFSFDFSSCRSM